MRLPMIELAALACLGVVGALPAPAAAAVPSRATTIAVKMDNEKCVSVITAALRAVPNVGEVRGDLERRVAIVSPAGLRTPSAKALWEAVEKTGHAVIQLQGPQGKFTSKPEN